MPKVVIVIPTYNELGNVGVTTSALAQVFKTIQDYDMHILFVDDNSPDGTGREIEKLVKKYPFVHLFKNKHKGGLGHAYKKGFTYAIDKLKADILFEFDADLSHDPKKIPAMLSALHAGADLVLGSRYIRGGAIPKAWGLHRKFLSIVGNLFIQMVMGNFKVHDWTTGYRAIKKETVLAVVPALQSKAFTGYSWQTGFLVKALQLGYQVVEVPFVFVDRTSGKSKLGPEYMVTNFMYIINVRMKELINNRIFKFAMVGGTGALVQFIALHLLRQVFPFQLAFFLAIETATLSNFTWSNLWTFADRRLKPIQIPLKFVQFNLASAGSIIIQQVIALIGENVIGLYTIYTIPGTAYTLDTGAMFAVVGILIGMFWNFFAYNRLIWKKIKS